VPRFSDFHYLYHFIEHIFLDYYWFISDNNFYWPEGWTPDFFKDEYDKSINTHNGLVVDLMGKGMFGIVSPIFMYTFYKNIWGDWLDVYAINKSDINQINEDYIRNLMEKKIDQINLENHPFLFQNVDGAFWVLKTIDKEIENNLIEHFGKLEGIEWEIIEKQYW
jgi:hypothetical protein